MTDQVETGEAASGVGDPRFPMPQAAIAKAVREGRPIGEMPPKKFVAPFRLPALAPGRVKLATAAYNAYFAEVESGTAREAILHPTFWAHAAAKLRRHDRIEVTDEQGSFLAVLIVRSADRNQAVVAELSYTEIKSPVAAEVVAESYTVKYRGPKYKHSVLDAKGNVVQENFGTAEEAAGWIANRAKAMAA